MSLRHQIVIATPTPKILDSRLKQGTYRYVDGELERKCSRCGEFWPADSEFFQRSPGATDGLHSWCKACIYETRRRISKPNTWY